jgi:hypothetical protein
VRIRRAKAICQFPRTGPALFAMKKKILKVGVIFKVEKCVSRNHKNTTNRPQKHHKKPSKKANFPQNACKNAIQRCLKKMVQRRKWWRRWESFFSTVLRICKLFLLGREERDKRDAVPWSSYIYRTWNDVKLRFCDPLLPPIGTSLRTCVCRDYSIAGNTKVCSTKRRESVRGYAILLTNCQQIEYLDASVV